MTDQDALTRQRKLVSALSSALEAQAGPVQVFETHISWVLVAGGFAYKFKKAVRFDFLDFSTLESRHFFCLEELRLNTRLAPDIYLAVVAITGRPEQPLLEGSGAPIEYAVKMRAFEQQALWSYRLQHRLVSASEADRLADRLARFHADAAVAPADSNWSSAAALQTIADETLAQIAKSVREPEEKRRAADLQAWDTEQRTCLGAAFAQRKAQRSIRECHGDLHGGNLLTIGGEVQAFDCIEFNESLRWIDVMNDIAFVCMDLRFRQRADLAARFLNRYLELTGDYHGLSVLRYYEVHRALIRCKVALLRAAQRNAGSDQTTARHEGLAYLAFAAQRIAPARAAIIIMHGFSGSGKSTLARRLVEVLDAIQLRSDVERKRIHGLTATSRGGSDLYVSDTIRQTYERLRTLARQAVTAGWPVIVDATFLRSEQRSRFRSLAMELGAPFFILDLQASEAAMRTRIAAREREEHDASDAGEEILAKQLASHDPLLPEEMRDVLALDAESGLGRDLAQAICDRIAGATSNPAGR